MRSYVAVLLSVLLVLSAVAPAAAQETTTSDSTQGHCSELDDFLFTVTNGLVNGGDCKPSHLSDRIQEMRESDANQTKTDIYTAGSSLKGQSEVFDSVYDNYMQDTESAAWMKMETAVAEAYQNGATEAEAKTQAKQAIADYYAVKQINLLEKWNASVSQVNTLKERAEMEDGVESRFVDLMAVDPQDERYPHGTTYNGTGTSSSVVLANQSTVESMTLKLGLNTADGPMTEFVNVTTGNVSWDAFTDGPYVASSVYIKPPTTDYSNLHVLKFSVYSSRWEKIEDLSSALQSEADNYVSATWEDFSTGTINASDVISSHTAMFEYGVRSSNESEGLYQSTAALAMMGYDTPNMTNAGTMTVKYNGANNTGLLLAENAPGGTWETGTTYQTSNISGPVMLATVDGKKLDLQGEFTIVGMTSKDGSRVESTSTTEYVYKTADTSETVALQNQLSNLRQEIEDREPDGGAGGGSDWSLPDWVPGGPLGAGVGTVGVIVLLGVVLAGRS